MDRAACEEAADRSARRATPGMETGAVCGASHDGIQFLQPRLARCVPESVLEDSAWFRYQDLVADDGHRQHRGDLRRHRIRLAVGTHRQAPCHHLGGVACIAHYAVLGIRIHALVLGVGAFLMQVSVQGAWGIIPVHLNELSPPEIRATFPGFVYQLGNLVASYNLPIQVMIAEDHGNNYGLAMASVVGTVVIVISLLVAWGPERRGIAMADAQREPATA